MGLLSSIFGSNKSSSSASTSNVSPTINFQPGAAGAVQATSLGKDSPIDIFNLTQLTDHGAIEAGTAIAGAGLDAVEGAVRDALSFGQGVTGRALVSVHENTADALATVRHSNESAADLVAQVIGKLHSVETDALNYNAMVSQNALNFASDASRSDAALALENITKYAAVAAGVVAVAWVLKA